MREWVRGLGVLHPRNLSLNILQVYNVKKKERNDFWFNFFEKRDLCEKLSMYNNKHLISI